MNTETIGDKIASEFSENKCHLTPAEIRRLAGMIDKAADDRDQLRRRVKELEAALNPFADAAENAVESCAPDHPRGSSTWTVEYDDLEAAYAAMCGAGKRVNTATDLLAALKLLVADVADYEAWQRPCHALDVARTAIAKAES